MLAQLSALALGLLAGAMVFIALAVAPFWQSLPPAEFRAWFAANAPRIARVMFPLGGVAAAASIAAWFVERRASGTRTASLALAAACSAGLLLITLLVNEPANQRFAAPNGLSDPETTALLARWVRWHGARVALGLVAFGATLRALARAGD